MSGVEYRAILAFTNQTIDSQGTVTSQPIDVGKSQFGSFQYELNSSYTGAYCVCSVNILCQATMSATGGDSQTTGGYIRPRDSYGDDVSYIGKIDSLNRFITFDFPMTRNAKIQIKSVTDTSLKIDNFWVIFDEIN